MRVITPEQFRDAFLKVVRAEEERLRSLWLGQVTGYTSFMRGTVLPLIAQEIDLNVYNRDYWTLDAVFYEEKDTDYFRSVDTYVKYLSVAFEHENNIKSSHIEANKLQLFNCPLKVLLTYPLDEKSKRQALIRYSAITRNADVFDDFSDKRRFLVIFGNSYLELENWSFHLYQSGEFVDI